jgi:hypothetical protein
MKRITITVNETTYALLEVLTKGQHTPPNVTEVVEKLIDHAQQGVYRPGSWERPWLEQVFGDDWQKYLEPGDPYGKPRL